MDTVIQLSTNEFRLLMALAFLLVFLFGAALRAVGIISRDNARQALTIAQLMRRNEGLRIMRDTYKARCEQLESAWTWQAGEPAPGIIGKFDEN